MWNKKPSWDWAFEAFHSSVFPFFFLFTTVITENNLLKFDNACRVFSSANQKQNLRRFTLNLEMYILLEAIVFWRVRRGSLEQKPSNLRKETEKTVKIRRWHNHAARELLWYCCKHYSSNYYTLSIKFPPPLIPSEIRSAVEIGFQSFVTAYISLKIKLEIAIPLSTAFWPQPFGLSQGYLLKFSRVIETNLVVSFKKRPKTT